MGECQTADCRDEAVSASTDAGGQKVFEDECNRQGEEQGAALSVQV